MTLRLYDTRAQRLRAFVPADPADVTMYVCGPTVQSSPHVGHVRAALGFDLLRRWLTHRFGRVTFVRNVTDIDDKVIANATPDEPWWALAYRVEREFDAAYSAVGILAPTYEPRATGSIPQMIELIERLIARGHAYAAADGSGDVYFDVRSWPAYGELTHQHLDAMEAASDADPRGKRDPHDFALWKGAKRDEPSDASWSTPWGAGRPGWHIECSAMARRYLGSAFDIHGGGLDLRFPHHENEIAQSRAAGDEFANYWVHNGLVTVNGQKMSKSLGNWVPLSAYLAEYGALTVRYALLAAHYRSSLDLTPTSFDEARSAIDRVRTYLDRARRALPADPGREAETGAAVLPPAFEAALDDDLAVPQALAVLHEWVRLGNAQLDAGDDGAVATALGVADMARVLGIHPHDAPWATTSDTSAETAALDALVRTMIDQRAQARADKDWGAADRIRDAIAAAGIALEDTPDGTHWSVQNG